MTSDKKPRKTRKPPWAGQRGPGYVFDEEGELRLFESVSWMLGRDVTKLGHKDDEPTGKNEKTPNP